jgi:hypothetical protein
VAFDKMLRAQKTSRCGQRRNRGERSRTCADAYQRPHLPLTEVSGLEAAHKAAADGALRCSSVTASWYPSIVAAATIGVLF